MTRLKILMTAATVGVTSTKRRRGNRAANQGIR
jgi:hypothetical protein